MPMTARKNFFYNKVTSAFVAEDFLKIPYHLLNIIKKVI